MRCFIAVDISEDVRKSIGGVINRLMPLSSGVRWVAPGNMHLTLKFLGDVKDGSIPDIVKKLEAICDNFGPFAIEIKGTGVFPSVKYPNVIWVGAGESQELKNIHAIIQESMSEAGFEREKRKFSPHFTVGRVKDRRNIDLLIKELCTFKATVFGSIYIEEILLMRSELKPSGAEYSRIAVFKLKS